MGKILFLETGEDYPVPNEVCYFLRNLAAQGIIDKLNGIIVGKPLDERYYDEYKQIYKTVICNEANQPDLPIALQYLKAMIVMLHFPPHILIFHVRPI